jgi:hypothetical protein
VTEVAKRREVPSAEPGRIGRAAVIIHDYQMLVDGGLHNRGRESVLSEVKFRLAAGIGHWIIGKIAEHGVRRERLSKVAETVFKRGDAERRGVLGIDGDQIQQKPEAGGQGKRCQCDHRELMACQAVQFIITGLPGYGGPLY